MRLLFSVLLVFSIACGKNNESFPKSYTFSHIDQEEEALFLITSEATATELDVNTGQYGEARDYVREVSAELIQVAFDLQEIELLSEDMVRIHILVDEEVIDTVVTYTKEDEEIIIEALSSSDIIYYDSNEDQFVVCGFSSVALPGPNTTNPGSHYNQIIVEDCQANATLLQHLFHFTDQNSVEVFDTVGILVTKVIYKNF